MLIAGDFNANRFDNRVEQFWDAMESDGWDVLADSPNYPASRLSGRPPAQRTGKIDYIIVSSGPGGLEGDEVAQETAVVHDELVTAAGGGFAFREKAIDHLPVSVMIRVRGYGDSALAIKGRVERNPLEDSRIYKSFDLDPELRPDSIGVVGPTARARLLSLLGTVRLWHTP